MSKKPEPLEPEEAEKFMEEGTDHGDHGVSTSDPLSKESESGVEGGSSPESEYDFKWLNDLLIYGVTASLFLVIGSTLLFPLIAVFVLIALIVGYFFWEESISSNYRRTKNRAVRALMQEYEIEGNGDRFVIKPRHRERDTSRERAYRREYKLTLLDEFGNCCCRCGAKKQGLDLDHFFIPKKDGGTFAMWHKDGFWVNNAIPLCQTCNRSKGGRSHTEFFDQEELIKIMNVNQRMTEMLNDDQFRGRGAKHSGGIDPSKVEVSDQDLEEPDTSVFAYMERLLDQVIGWASAISDTGESIGDLIFSCIFRPSLIWWIELKLHEKIVLSLTVGCIAFVLSLFVFGT